MTKSNIQKIVKIQSILIALLIVAVIASFYTQGVFDSKNKDIIRTKGIIIVDENNKERILLGAPVPYAINRVRTDTARVWKYWGNNEPEFMEWYKEYDHRNYGMLILDSLGFDRIAIGNHVPDLSFGQRVGPMTGIVLNNAKGNERTGYGILDINGKDRVNIGLDREDGTEGLTMALDENGVTGFKVLTPKGSIFMGKTDSINPFTHDGIPFSGVMQFNANKWQTIFSAATEMVKQ